MAENLDIPLSYRNIKKSERDRLVADASGQVWLGRSKAPLSKPALRRLATTGRRGPRSRWFSEVASG